MPFEDTTANATMYPCQDEFSYITGQIILVDGGCRT